MVSSQCRRCVWLKSELIFFAQLELRLERYEEQELRCFGKLYADDVYICDTLEDTDRHLEDYLSDREKGKSVKQYGKTAIPCGKYKVTYYYWQKHSNWYPWIQDVPFFSGILVHGGITENQTLGCVLVGTRSGERLVKSGEAMVKIRSLFANCKQCEIIVKRSEG